MDRHLGKLLMKIGAKRDSFDSKDILSLLTILSIWAVVFSSSGIFTAGFNYFVDDHTIVVSHYNYTSFNDIIITPFTSLFSGEVQSRFRPLYDVFIRLFSQLYGLNSYLWYLSSFLVAAATTGIFYLGQQASTYARFGTPETTSTFLLALAFLFASLNHKDFRRSFVADLLFVLFALLSALNKEACILILPALCFFKVWNLSTKNKISLTAALLESRWSVMSVLAIFMGAIAYIKLAKVNGPGYAGIDRDTLSIDHLLFSLTANGAMFGLAILASIVYARSPHKEKIGSAWIFCAAIVIPQLIIYNKTGMAWHYVLPCAIGISFMTFYLIEKISNRSQLQGKVLMILATIVIILQIFFTQNYFRETTNRLAKIQSIVADVSTCVDRSDTLAIVGNPYTDYEALEAFNKIIVNGIIKNDRYVLATYADREANVHLSVMKDREKSWYFLNPQKLEEFYHHRTIDTLSVQDRTNLAGIVLMNSTKVEKSLAELKLDWFSPERLSKKYYPELDMSVYCKSRSVS
jgi:hypothetical protein